MPATPDPVEHVKTAVVVLNWNGAEDTLACLRSLSNGSSPPPLIIVVDNASTDDSVFLIRQSTLADVVLENRENLGFAEGNNVGIRHALALDVDVVAILNNDTLASAAAINELASLAAWSRQLIAISPIIRYVDSSDIWFQGGVVDRGWPRHLQADEVQAAHDGKMRETETLSGCCIVADRRVWTKNGLFDPAYFLIFEDSEWSVRARRCGVTLFVAPTVEIAHKVSRSFTGSTALLAAFYFARNGLRFVRTHHSRHLPRFLVKWVLRPTASAIVRRRPKQELGFRWLGVAAFAVNQSGQAPQWVMRRARRASASAAGEASFAASRLGERSE